MIKVWSKITISHNKSNWDVVRHKKGYTVVSYNDDTLQTLGKSVPKFFEKFYENVDEQSVMGHVKGFAEAFKSTNSTITFNGEQHAN